jgi:putative transcriptional regulator
MAQSDDENITVFEQIKRGLQQSISQARGDLTLRTTALPAPPPAASPRRVLKLRKKLGMSQSLFAATLNVSPKLVQSWEQGLRKPDRGALRLLQLIEARPDLVAEFFHASSRMPKGRRRAVA